MDNSTQTIRLRSENDRMVANFNKTKHNDLNRGGKLDKKTKQKTALVRKKARN